MLIPIAFLVTNSSTTLANTKTIEMKYVSECFSGVAKEQNTLIEAFLTKNRSKFKNETMKQRFKQKLETIFSKNEFDNYKQILSCRNIKYKVDDIWVAGFIIYPKSEYMQKLPVIIANRGGNGDFGKMTFAPIYSNLFPLAAEGFFVIGSQYREQDQFGGDDLNDVTALFDIISQNEQADASRIGMFGASRGGMQTFMLSRNEVRIKAVATIAAVTELSDELIFRPAMENVYKARIPSYLSNKNVELNKRSIMHWLDEIDSNLPMLLIHGEHDKRVSVDNSKRLAALLKQQQRTHKLIIYPEDNHKLSRNKQRALGEISDWFKKYL